MLKYSFKTYIFVISSLLVVTQMSVDLYLPSIPQIAGYFGVTIDAVQFTMFFYTVGYLTGALFYGPISDRVGRRKIFVVALLISSIGSLICIQAGSIEALYLGRVLQGVGFGGVNVLCRVSMKDISKDLPQLIFAITILNVFWSVALSLSPCIGGYILNFFSWRAEFISVFILSFIFLLGFVFLLDETNANFVTTPITKVMGDYMLVLSNKRFLTYAFSSASCSALLIAYLTYSPHLLMQRLKLSPVEFGYTNILLSFGILIGTKFNHMATKKIRLDKLINSGSIIAIIGGVIYLLTGLLHIENTTIILIPMFMYGFCSMLILGNCSGAAISLFSDISGSAGAAFTFIQMIGGVVGSFIMSLITNINQTPLGLVFIIFGGVVFILSQSLLKSKFIFTK